MASATGPLQPPGSNAAPQGQGPGAGGPPIAPQEAQPDSSAAVLGWVRDIIATSRRIGFKYPAAMAEVREIQNAVSRMQQKIVQSQPAPEPMTPPV